jgi:hypothetical protein
VILFNLHILHSQFLDRNNFLELFEAVVKGDGRQGAEMMVKYATDSQCQGESLGMPLPLSHSLFTINSCRTIQG